MSLAAEEKHNRLLNMIADEEESDNSDLPDTSSLKPAVATPSVVWREEPFDVLADNKRAAVPGPSIPAGQECLFAEDKKIPVKITIDAGVNALTRVPTTMTLTFNAFDAQVNADFISVMYRSSFDVSMPAFTRMKLTIADTRYSVMCVGAARKFGSFVDLNFIIASSEDGEASNR